MRETVNLARKLVGVFACKRKKRVVVSAGRTAFRIDCHTAVYKRCTLNLTLSRPVTVKMNKIKIFIAQIECGAHNPVDFHLFAAVFKLDVLRDNVVVVKSGVRKRESEPAQFVVKL